jgi:hypothetical protein
MIELDERIKQELEQLVPMPHAARHSWEDALQRAELRPRTRRRVTMRRLGALAFAALFLGSLAASPVGGAIAGGIGDFSEWLRGEPGEPATEEAQRRFESENARSWAAFPDGPQLRRLAMVQSAGATFELFGFRTGNSLCLRLTVTGLDDSPATGCAPIDELRSARQPALVLVTDYSFGRQEDVEPNDEGLVPAKASATFGIVADGVRKVELVSNRGRHSAVLRHNAFLAIVADPPLGLRTKRGFATVSDGLRLPIEVAESPFGYEMPVATPGIAPGPTEVDRRLERGTISWLLRREERGRSLEQAGGFPLRLPPTRWDISFARVLRPDPAGFMRLAVALVTIPPKSAPPGDRTRLHVCSFLISRSGAGGGCSPLALLFPRGPFTVSTSIEQGGNQYAVLSGLASDDVARLELFLATGERVAVPLKDNAYIVEAARAKYPIRLVAYDSDARVIGIEHMAHDPLADPGPRPVRDEQRVVLTVTAANGTRGVLRVGPSTDGGRCWRVSFTGGAGGGGCPPKAAKIPLLALGLQDAGRDSFVTGTVGEEIAQVELRLESGRIDTVEPVEDFVLYPVPSGDRVRAAVGFDDSGKEVARQRFSNR